MPCLSSASAAVRPPMPPPTMPTLRCDDSVIWFMPGICGILLQPVNVRDAMEIGARNVDGPFRPKTAHRLRRLGLDHLGPDHLDSDHRENGHAVSKIDLDRDGGAAGV